jgi:phosphoadenosine phosphosulfate reductase
MDKYNLEKINNELVGKTPKEIIEYAYNLIGTSKVSTASSLSIEDQMLTHLALSVDKNSRIFVLDTGRHFQNTYDVMDETWRKYGFKYEIYAPNTSDLEKFVSNYGPNTFYIDVENRKKCCNIRKLEPLKRALSTVDAWITGLRREQGVTRTDIPIVDWDDTHKILKFNPLIALSEVDVWDYVKENKIPYNDLYLKGFRSIGCQPCTRAVKEGEDIRAGRWWWESPEQKECGLHVKK